MLNHGDPYFTCIIEEWTSHDFKNKSMDCLHRHAYNVYWPPKDEDKFFADLTDATSIDPSWVAFTVWWYMPCFPEQ